MDSNRRQRQSPTAFLVAGALMGAVMLLFGLMIVSEFPVWPLLMLAIGLAGLACAVGLLGVEQALRHRAPGPARTGAVLSAIGGGGALTVVMLVPVGLVVNVWMGLEPRLVGALFAISVLTMLGGLLAGLLLVGAAAWRSRFGGPALGPLLVAGGLLLLFPLSDLLLGFEPPQWLPIIAFGAWATIFLAVGITLRTARAGAQRHDPVPA